MQPIQPFLSFPENNAEEAARYYLSVFKNSREIEVNRTNADWGPFKAGDVMTIVFELNGTQFVALNGGPKGGFNLAVSFVVKCKDQAEIDYYWSTLTAGGGKEIDCGWLTDKFGLSWQIVPENIGDLVKKPGAMKAMMTMKRLDIVGMEAGAAKD